MVFFFGKTILIVIVLNFQLSSEKCVTVGEQNQRVRVKVKKLLHKRRAGHHQHHRPHLAAAQTIAKKHARQHPILQHRMFCEKPQPETFSSYYLNIYKWAPKTKKSVFHVYFENKIRTFNCHFIYCIITALDQSSRERTSHVHMNKY